MNYEGSCHCKSTTFRFDAPEITSGLRCNCTICCRKGATMTAFTLSPDKIDIKSEEGSLSVYEFGACVAKHYFCSRCGIYPFHQTLRKPGDYRINIGCIHDIDASNLPFDVFDGAAL